MSRLSGRKINPGLHHWKQIQIQKTWTFSYVNKERGWTFPTMGKALSPYVLFSKTSICTPSGDSCTPYGPKVALPEFQPMDTYDLNLCDSDRLLHVSMTFQRYLKWGWRKWWQKCVYIVPYWFQFNLLTWNPTNFLPMYIQLTK